MAGRHFWLLPAILVASPALAEPLPRVMSLNVCTDQLVLALAEPAQILSLSGLADDHALSFFHEEAAAYPKNSGLAEEVFVTRPDVVVTGTYSLHNTTGLLQQIGLRVEEFGFTQTLDTIPTDIRRMGAILGRADLAEASASAFERDLAQLTVPEDAPRPTIIVYDQNGVVLGSETLTHSALEAAGWRNLAAERGIVGMVPYSLERLVIDRPDTVLVNPPYDRQAPSLADQASSHPALRTMGSVLRSDPSPQASAACGGPFTLEAVRAFRVLRDEVLAARAKAAPG